MMTQPGPRLGRSPDRPAVTSLSRSPQLAVRPHIGRRPPRARTARGLSRQQLDLPQSQRPRASPANNKSSIRTLLKGTKRTAHFLSPLFSVKKNNVKNLPVILLLPSEPPPPPG